MYGLKSSLMIVPLVFSSSLFANSNSLPNWIDHSKEIQLKSSAIPSFRGDAPETSLRLPAEWEKAQAIALAYGGYESMLDRIAEIATTKGGVRIWAAEAPSEIPGADETKVDRLGCPLDTVWIRDYGPFGITGEGKLGIVDTIYRHYAYRVNDDAMPECMAREKNVDHYAMSLILDGGNLMVDSKGNLFMTNRTYLWNSNKSREQVDSLLKSYFRVNKIHVFDYAGYPGSPLDGTGHIDMFVKLLSDETVLIAETSAAGFKEAAEKAVTYFKSIKTPSGGDYKIIRIPAWTSGRTWYTYTNSLIVNNVVIVPGYYGKAAIERDVITKAYQAGRPGIQVEFVNSDSSITAGGSIHCVTQLIPSTEEVVPAPVVDPAPTEPTNSAGPFSLLEDGKTSDLFRAIEQDPSLLKKKNSSKNTLLHVATQLDKLDVVSFLVSKGISLNDRNSKFCRPLNYASGSTYNFLKSKGATRSWLCLDSRRKQ